MSCHCEASERSRGNLKVFNIYDLMLRDYHVGTSFLLVMTVKLL